MELIPDAISGLSNNSFITICILGFPCFMRGHKLLKDPKKANPLPVMGGAGGINN